MTAILATNKNSFKKKARVKTFFSCFFWGGVFCHFCYFGHLVFFWGGSNTFPPFFSVLLMWSLLKGALLARSLPRSVRLLPRSLSFFREALVADPDAAHEFLVSIPCTSVVVVVGVFFPPSDVSGAEGTNKDLVR
jgi:hypothetical protein